MKDSSIKFFGFVCKDKSDNLMLKDFVILLYGDKSKIFFKSYGDAIIALHDVNQQNIEDMGYCTKEEYLQDYEIRQIELSLEDFLIHIEYIVYNYNAYYDNFKFNSTKVPNDMHVFISKLLLKN